MIFHSSRRLLFLLILLSRAALAECCYLLGNCLPGKMALICYRLALVCQPLHTGAASQLAWAKRYDARNGWIAFQSALALLRNPGNVSASDLALAGVPGAGLRRIIVRLEWGGWASEMSARSPDVALQQLYTSLAQFHFHQALQNDKGDRAQEALNLWHSLAGETLSWRWARLELIWHCGKETEIRALAQDLVPPGLFLSPQQAVIWAERFRTSAHLELANICLKYARRWLPDFAEIWRVQARLARCSRRTAEACRCYERALSLAPDHLETLLEWLALRSHKSLLPERAQAARLEVNMPEVIPLGASVRIDCQLHGGTADWRLFVLPPSGLGLLPSPRQKNFDTFGMATVMVTAHRPDRINAGAWKIHFAAVCDQSYIMTTCEVHVPDPRPGRILVTVTEDHEIHEERGSFTPRALEQLLVEKSRFAADLGVRWTHMVETGSTLALLDAVASTSPAWQALRTSVNNHLLDELQRGNDLQPHLHAFNDPAYAHCPYSWDEYSLKPSLRFLLTSPEQRGDWASVCPPPGHASASCDRQKSVENAVARLESLARQADPDYRAVLWRSGLLEFGDTPNDRAWSGVALRAAGLLADSDLAKPSSPWTAVVPPAYPASPEDPFAPEPGGRLLQLPIAANLEGDYIMGTRLLRRRARNSVLALRDAGGQISPGIHLFTLLTHDKFINARLEQEENCLNPDYGDWVTIREHIKAWQAEGAEFVTTRGGIRAVLDDLSWHPIAWLREETFILGAEQSRIRFRLDLLGRDIAITEDWPAHVYVVVPPSLRSQVSGITAVQGTQELAVEHEPQAPGFWLVLQRRNPTVFCTFDMNTDCGPQLDALDAGVPHLIKLRVSAEVPFRRARLLLPWQFCGEEAAKHHKWQVANSPSDKLDCEVEANGLLIFPVAFLSDDQKKSGYVAELRLHATAVAETNGRYQNELQSA